MPLDPRMFLGIGGPVPNQAMLPPGFRPPPPVGGPPIMQPQGQPMGGAPSMGMGMGIPKGVGVMGSQSGVPLAQTAAGTSAAETASPFATTPTGIVGGESAMGGGGSFSSWLSGLFGGSSGGAGAGSGAGLGGMSSFLGPMAYAAGIGIGKNTEANHPNTPVGDTLLGGLGPSASQVIKDPIGMGLPTLLGAPFLTPFTGSKDAKKAKPEWSGLFGLGF